MDQSFRDKLRSHTEKYKQELEAKRQERGGKFEHIAYGTAGFRGDACQIEHLFFNIGILSGLRALDLGANVGVMITASHNPVQDNGVKLIDKNGEMLQSDWEQLAEEFCNNQGVESRIQFIENLLVDHDIHLLAKKEINVLIGMDTRPSSEALASLVKRGFEVWSDVLSLHDYGILTTPAIHYLVAESNLGTRNDLLELDDYYNLLINALTGSGYVDRGSDQRLIVDCANGVGSETMQFLINNHEFRSLMPGIELINFGNGCLNKDCGADYVKSRGNPPKGANQLNTRYAALDGDADRIVYFFLGSSHSDCGEYKLHILDGDRILSLYALYLREIMDKCCLQDKMSLGIVQTPYANGASTSYLTDKLGLEVAFTDTGVKNLHKKALEYDMAIYFEANGHGTIHVADKAKIAIQNHFEKTIDPDCAKLRHLLNTLNNYTGDAVSDMILVEVILQHYNWNIEDWYKLYDERPNSLIKLQVPDKDVIKTTNAGQTCTTPKDVQPVIDATVKKFGSGARCFVRPSGTENVVRIYSEASTQERSDSLALQVKGKLVEILGAR